MTTIKPFAFVLMPFSDDYRDIYELGIKAAAVDCGFVAERVDEQNFSETILERVYRQIEQSDVIIAEMSGRNPNVFYEVGYAHAKQKSCILLTSSANDIPFDLKHHPHVIYNGSVTDLKAKISTRLLWKKSEIDIQKTKTISVSGTTRGGSLKKEEWRHKGSFSFFLRLKNSTKERSPEIEAIYVRTRPGWELSVDSAICPTETVDEKAGKLRHLIIPQIRRLGPDAFAEIEVGFERTLWSKYGTVNSEKKEEYEMKGTLRIEVVTSEGSYNEEIPIEVLFEEFPF